MWPGRDLPVYLATEPCDMRRQIDGLARMVQCELDKDPFSGRLFVFVNRQRDKLKLLYWDRNGFAIWYKRLERGRFKLPRGRDGVLEVSQQELDWLLSGLDIERVQGLPELQFNCVA